MTDQVSFPGEVTRYLPVGISERAMRGFALGYYDIVRAEIERMGAGDYERVGLDRALAIALDIAASEPPVRYSILDVGCSTGLLGELLSRCGYTVTGIDRDTVSRTHGRLRIAATELDAFLAENDETFDVALLLNVLHWFPAPPEGTVPPVIEELCRRVRSHLYIEVPIAVEHEEFDASNVLLYPQALLGQRIATQVRWIATTIATNGKTRRLYRVDVK